MKTKKQLYESIMKDVSKIVKKHLNEDIENSWDDTYMANVLTWINNTVSDPDELEYAITEYFDLSKKAPHENANNIGYGIANLMMAKLDAGGMDMVFPQKYNKDNFIPWLVKSFATGIDANMNNNFSEKIMKYINNRTYMDIISEGFYHALSEEGYSIIFAESENEAYELAESGEYYNVCLCNSNGEWEQI